MTTRARKQDEKTATWLILTILATVCLVELLVHYLVHGFFSGWKLKTEITAAVINVGLLVAVSAPFIRKLINRHLRQEELIRTSEQRYRALIESAPDGIVIVDGQGLITEINGRAVILFGYDRHELEGKPVEVLLPKHRRERHREHVTKYNAEPRIRTLGVGEVLMGCRKDGSVFPVEISLSPLQLGKQSLTIAAVRDATERTEFEYQRKAAEERIYFQASLLNQVRNSVIVADVNGLVTYWNKYAEILYGWTEQEALGRPVAELVLPPEHTIMREEVRHGLEARGYWEGKTIVSGKNGERFLVFLMLSSLRGEDGQSSGYVGVSIDITEMKRVEDKLLQKTNQLQTITDALGSFLETASWRRANESLLKGALAQSQSLYGFAGVVVEGPALRILAHEGLVWSQDTNREFYEDALRTYEQAGYLEFKDFNNLFGRVITTGKPVLSNDCHNDSKSGGIPAGHPPLNSFLGVPIIEGSQVIGIIGVANRPGGYTAFEQEHLRVLAQTAGVLFDAYRRQQHEESLEAQLRQAQKMEAVGRLAGGVAHDFNNLLTVIKGYSQMLTDSPLPEPAMQPLGEIEKAVDRAVSLTRQLLAFSRRQVLQPKIFDVNALIKNIEPMVQRLVGEDIELQSLCEANPATIKADVGQIEQVIMNLVVNARDAMPQGGQLIIRTATVQLSEKDTRAWTGLLPGRFVLISVTDTGCGMDASIRAHIFEPFFTTKEAGKGTGLGLSTVYGIIHQSGGAVEVASRAGRGTTFSIHLPLSLETPGEEPAIETSAPVAAGKTILLIEDDPMVRDLTSRMLNRSGYEVLQASNGAEALEQCRVFSRPIHLALSDVVMPGLSGPETVLRLKSIRPGMKALFMSGYIGDTIAQHGIRESGLTFLEKPFTPASLDQKVAEALRTTPDTVVVADDDESILHFVCSTLEVAGFRVLPAANGVEALKLLRESGCLLLITDLMMPCKDGIDLAIEVQREFPGLPIIAISGAGNLRAISLATELKDVQLLEKPFDKERLLRLVGELV